MDDLKGLAHKAEVALDALDNGDTFDCLGEGVCPDCEERLAGAVLSSRAIVSAVKRTTKVEYLVTWKRVGCSPKRKRYCSRLPVDRFLLLLGPEPWLAYGKGPDDAGCDHGYQGHEAEACCPAFGETMAQRSERERREMPPIEWVRVSRRDVSPWRIEK